MDEKSSLINFGLDHYALSMAVAPKKTAPRAKAPKKQRLSQSEATVRMLNATSQLLLENAPGEVTVARICEKAGVHTDYVARYFGSREELMCQSIDAAFVGVFLSTNNPDIPRVSLILEGNINVMELSRARVRTIAYLLGCGVSPERFQTTQKMLLDSVLTQSQNPNVSERTKLNLILIGMLVVQGMSTFSEINDMSESQKTDIVSYLGYLSQSGEMLQESLGWDKPLVKPKSKKTK